MVQPRGGLGLAGEPGEEHGIAQTMGDKHLQRHSTAQRFLFGLVNHAHATTTDLAQHPVVAQALEPLLQAGNLGPREGARGIARAGLEVLHQTEHREELTDLVGEVGIPGDVFIDRRLLTPSLALEEFVEPALRP